MPLPKKNNAFSFDVSLVDAANRPQFRANPTLAAGDVKVSINGGAFANLATLPTVSPAGGRNVNVSLSAAEMNGDRICVQFVDQTAAAEWDDVVIDINTSTNIIEDVIADTDDIQTRLPAALVGGRIDSSVGAYQAGLAPLQPSVAGRTLDVTATGAAGIDWANVENQGTAVNLSATNIDVDQVVASVTGAVGSVTGNVGGNVVGAVGSVTAGVTVATNNDKTGYALTAAERNAIADAWLDRADAIETGITPRLALRYTASILVGQLSGSQTGAETFKAIAVAGTTRVVVTADASGNRTGVALT